MPYPVDKNDVWVEDYLVPDCDGCSGGFRELKQVLIDLRSLGQSVHIGLYCPTCLPGILQSLRDSLPEPDTDSPADERAVAAKHIAETRALSCLGCGGRRPVDVDLCDACREAEVEPTEDYENI